MKRNQTVRIRFPQVRFNVLRLAAASLFVLLCPARADVIYTDGNGKIISSENAKMPVISTPSSESFPPAQEKPAFDPDHPGLDYSGITLYYSDKPAPDRVVLRFAPPDAVNLVIPDGVTEIQAGAFWNCKSLKSVSFPNSLNYIPESCFPDHIFGPTLKSVTIPVHASIGDKAFMFCRSLESVTITKGGETIAPPRADAFIGEDAFSSCYALKRFEFPDGIRSIGNHAFLSCAFDTAVLPDSVTEIGEDAFSGVCIKTLKLPSNLKKIGRRAFLGCTVLEDFEMPSGPVDIGAKAFDSCFALRHVKVPRGASRKLPDSLFEYCRNLETVELPAGLASIGENAFAGCAALKEIDLPDTVESIGFRAFSACENLERITLPANLKKIGSAAFWYCPKLRRVALPEHIESFADAFDLSITRLTLPEGNTRYKFTPEGALIDDENHVFLAFPHAITGHYTIPDGILAVAPRAFRSCAIRGVTIPPGVTSLGSGAFAYSALEEIAIPETVTEFQTGENIPGMTQHASAFESTDPPHFEEHDRGLFVHCTRLKRVALPENMKEIPFAMFKQCSSLEEIAIPESVKTIGECAFWSCGNLKRIKVPSGVRVLPPRVFGGCEKLESVELPSGLESIDYYAFLGCLSLLELELPGSVRTVNDFAFQNSACEKNLHDLIEAIGERKAAEDGDVDLQYKMGCLYQFGIAFEENPEEAVTWYRRAAEQGHADAQFALGSCYENGKGVEADGNEAVKWYRKAAEQGHADAQDALDRLQPVPR